MAAPDDPRIARFLALKARFPDSEMPRWTLATLYEGAGRFDEAIREFQDLVALKPDYCVAYVHLGSCLFEEERHTEALAALGRGHALAVEQGHEQPRVEAELLMEQVRDEMD